VTAQLDFNPMISPHREDPHVFYQEARERPVEFSPSIGAYMVTRYADLVAVLDDPQTFSSRAALPMIYDNPPEVTDMLRVGGVPETTMVVNEDEPDHIRFRRVFDAGFTGARVRAMVPLMRERAAALIDGFSGASSGNRADLVAGYAVPFVQAVISAVIGFPPEDTARIQAWTDDVNMLWNMLAPVEARVESARRMADYTRYLQALIDHRRARPREDLISDLVHGANGYPGVPDEYAHNMIRGAARVAGFDTTRDAITATVLIMLENPGVASGSWPTRPGRSRGSPRRRCAGTPRTAACSGSPRARWNWAERPCRPAPRCCCCSGRATGTRPSSAARTRSTWTAPTCGTTWPSDAACTPARAPRWRGPRSGSRWRP
jgi:cytochrome P450